MTATALNLELVESTGDRSSYGHLGRGRERPAWPLGPGFVSSGTDVVGCSAAFRQVLAMIEAVAATEATVLLQGESGTGKGVLANLIHERSRRRGRIMVAVNCASIPRELFESEFFGHAQGAFTGAVRARPGRFHAANGGTLLLDEVGETPPEVQAKLLRVLQEGCYERVGEERTRSTDVRVIAATNRDLETDVAEARFRRDLYYRLNVFPITIPPLRDRPEDIAPLAEHYLDLASRTLGLTRPRLEPEDLSRLRAHDWPGNVRELKNVLERALITAGGGPLRIEPGSSNGAARSAGFPLMQSRTGVLTEAEMRRLEHDNLRAALRACAGKVYGPGGAAELLGLPPTTVASRLRRLELASVGARARSHASAAAEAER